MANGTKSPEMFGRTMITSHESVVTTANVYDIVSKALVQHNFNRADIQYLDNYYKGKQPILNREKQIRPEINNKVVENRALEIVSFKTGYLIGSPIQYVASSEKNDLMNKVVQLNNYLLLADKVELDEELVEWMHVCGIGYRMVLPNPTYKVGNDTAPFNIYTLDPKSTFVVYSNDLGNTPLLAGVITVNDDNVVRIAVYSDDAYYELVDSDVVKVESNPLGIPIIEYKLNRTRMGAFEPVLGILDAMNLVESNRMDGVEQFIQAILKFRNVDVTEEDMTRLREQGAIVYRDIDSNLKGEIDYLSSELNQTQVQTLLDSMYATMLTICGMPQRNGGSSTSDTGTAVIMRDGWQDAEARAKKSELSFTRCEKSFLRKLLHILRDRNIVDIQLADMETHFTRHNYENIAGKATVLTLMLSTDKIAPSLAFTCCGLFPDPELAYKQSVEHYEKVKADAVVEPIEPTAVVVEEPED